MFKKISLIALLSLLIILPIAVSAFELKVGEQPLVGSEEVINNDLYIFGGNITSSGSVFGDLVVGGGNILIDGSISEDLLIGGGTVTVSANIGDDIRIGGGNITITSDVGDDVVVAGGQIQISGGNVGGDILIAGGSVTINSPVIGNVKIFAGEVHINSEISGNVEFNGDKLTLGEKTIIKGDLNYSSSEEGEINENAVIEGETIYEKNTTKDDVGNEGRKILAGLISIALIGGFLMKLTGALAFGLIFHKYSETLVNRALSKPLPELGRGFVSLIIIPVASVILMITVIGLPLGVFGFVAYASFLVFSLIMAPVLLGSLLHKWIKKTDTYHISWKIILLGVAGYSIVGFIPVIGWIIKFAFMLLVLGASSKMKWDLARQWR